MSYTKMRMVRIKEKTEVGEFNDAIYYTEDEWSKVKKSDIDAEVKKRVDNWVDRVKNPPTYVEPTKEELEKMKQERLDEIEQIDSKISAIDAKVVEDVKKTEDEVKG